MNNLDSEMEKEIDELRRRYQTKRQPILDAIDQKRKRQQNFWYGWMVRIYDVFKLLILPTGMYFYISVMHLTTETKAIFVYVYVFTFYFSL